MVPLPLFVILVIIFRFKFGCWAFSAGLLCNSFIIDMFGLHPLFSWLHHITLKEKRVFWKSDVGDILLIRGKFYVESF